MRGSLVLVNSAHSCQTAMGTLLIVSTARLLCCFPFQRLHDQLRPPLYQRAGRILLPSESVAQQIVQLLANPFTRWYPLLGV